MGDSFEIGVPSPEPMCGENGAKTDPTNNVKPSSETGLDPRKRET